MTPKHCIVCDTPVPAGKDRYCSRACYEQSYKIEKPPRTCSVCGVELQDARAKYCDDPACRREQNRRAKTKAKARRKKPAAKTYTRKEHPTPAKKERAEPWSAKAKRVDPKWLRRGDTDTLRVGNSFMQGMTS